MDPKAPIISMTISFIIPVFNEQDAIPVFLKQISQTDFYSEHRTELIFVNDGSIDLTEEILNQAIQDNPNIVLINFSRNFGKESALFAGISYANGDAVIPIDVDLQDPLEIIPEMINKWQQGFDVVLGQRKSRPNDSYLKKLTAEKFYCIFNMITDIQIKQNVGDFRLLDKKVVEEIKKLPEKNLFMKGLLSWVGFKTTTVQYERQKRTIGNTKFNYWKLWNLAIEGFTSFSTIPLRLWTYLGAGVACFSFMYALTIIFEKIFYDNPVKGYPSLMVAILFIGGVQLIGIGVLGEYIGRIYTETKNRPRYIIQSIKRQNK